MKIGVCDFPSQYSFPPTGYGSIERWLWACAEGAHTLGADVHLIGPQWRKEVPIPARRLPFRLESIDSDDAQAIERLRECRLDLLIVGHEYLSLPSWRAIRDQVEIPVATFQHMPTFAHHPTAFDGVGTRLCCYSAEMMSLYRHHRPSQCLSVQTGIEEDPLPARQGDSLIWMGRLCAEKAPHLAALAARKVNRPIRFFGPVHDTDYMRRHRHDFDSPLISFEGEVGQTAKTQALASGTAMVYTYARDYIEAGAAVFGDALRAGTPVVALTWNEGTCPHAALCDNTGTIAVANPKIDDEEAVALLADALNTTGSLDPSDVQTIGLQRFDPATHVRHLLGHT